MRNEDLDAVLCCWALQVQLHTIPPCLVMVEVGDQWAISHRHLFRVHHDHGLVQVCPQESEVDVAVHCSTFRHGCFKFVFTGWCEAYCGHAHLDET